MAKAAATSANHQDPDREVARAIAHSSRGRDRPRARGRGPGARRGPGRVRLLPRGVAGWPRQVIRSGATQPSATGLLVDGDEEKLPIAERPRLRLYRHTQPRPDAPAPRRTRRRAGGPGRPDALAGRAPGWPPCRAAARRRAPPRRSAAPPGVQVRLQLGEARLERVLRPQGPPVLKLPVGERRDELRIVGQVADLHATLPRAVGSRWRSSAGRLTGR